jgi:hypothetical protein
MIREQPSVASEELEQELQAVAQELQDAQAALEAPIDEQMLQKAEDVIEEECLAALSKLDFSQRELLASEVEELQKQRKLDKDEIKALKGTVPIV